jgi:hypothetical protein
MVRERQPGDLPGRPRGPAGTIAGALDGIEAAARGVERRPAVAAIEGDVGALGSHGQRDASRDGVLLAPPVVLAQPSMRVMASRALYEGRTGTVERRGVLGRHEAPGAATIPGHGESVNGLTRRGEVAADGKSVTMVAEGQREDATGGADARTRAAVLRRVRDIRETLARRGAGGEGVGRANSAHRFVPSWWLMPSRIGPSGDAGRRAD